MLLQINALERIDVQKGIDIRWERRFYEATRTGVRRDPTSVDPSRAEDFESLIARKEALLTSGKRIGASINVSAVWVGSGATIWFYDWIVVDEASSDQRAEILVDCDDAACRELHRPSLAVSTGPVQGSISGFSTAGYPEDETQAIFSGLVRRLVTDLAERFAGRRS